MTVVFKHKNKLNRRYTIPIFNEDKTRIVDSIVFIGAQYSTTDKEKVQFLLSNGAFRNRDIYLATDDKLVGEWLENDTEPSYLTKEKIAELSDACVIELGKATYKVSQNNPALLRNELIEEPVSDLVDSIITKHKPAPKKPSRSKVTKVAE
jgi:hypothetical protein